MKFEELVDVTGSTGRHIRYLISERLIPPPTGGRAHAQYGDDHVAAIRRYTRLRDLGFPPAAIRLLLGATEGVPVPVVPGLTLVIDMELIGSGVDAEPIAASASAKIHELLAKERCRVPKRVRR